MAILLILALMFGVAEMKNVENDAALVLGKSKCV